MVRNTSAASAKASAKIEAFPAIKVRTFADHVPGPAPVTIVRKSAAALTATEQQTFMNAITSAIADGAYSTLVRIHAIMSHDMHTMPGRPAGTQRFLPWHRLYLINFEQDMRRFEPTFFVPYWHWMDQSHIPDWMTGFKPKGVTDANGKPIVVTRRPGTNPQAPTLTDVAHHPHHGHESHRIHAFHACARRRTAFRRAQSRARLVRAQHNYVERSKVARGPHVLDAPRGNRSDLVALETVASHTESARQRCGRRP